MVSSSGLERGLGNEIQERGSPVNAALRLTLAFVHLLRPYSALHLSPLSHRVPATGAQQTSPDQPGRTGGSTRHESTSVSWKKGSGVKSIRCSCRRPGFGSKHPHVVLQPSSALPQEI